MENYSLIDITLEKICMVRSQRGFKSLLSADHRDFESTVTKFVETALADENIKPRYFDDDQFEDSRHTKRDFLFLAYTICIRVMSWYGVIDEKVIGGLSHHIMQHLPHDEDYALFTLCLAMYMMQIQKNGILHFAEYSGALYDICKKHGQEAYYSFFQIHALNHKQRKSYNVDYSLFTPSAKLVNSDRDWCFYTHGFRESYVKAWLDLMPTVEEKLQLCDRIERSFEKNVKTIQDYEDLYNEEMADF